MHEHNISKEIPGLVLTGARYVLAERITRKVRNDEPVTADLAGFIVADILDGAILRMFEADTPLRRVADGVVDHLSMGRVTLETAKKYPDSRLYLGILTARAALVGGANALHMLKTGEVTKGQSKQRAANLATAAFGLVALTGNKKATHVAGVITSGISAVAAIPHFRNIGKTSESEMRML